MVTIYDIARRVGCAPLTVSRALGGAYGVREKTKKEILLAAKEMNYVPDSTAKNLKSKRSWNIGVIMYVEGLSGLKHYLFAEILDSFANVVESHNYDITLFSKNIVLSKKSLLEHCRSKRLDGVFIVCGDFTAKPIKELLASEIPVVTVDYFNAGMENINCVTSDNRRKMYDLTEYILENGHRDILYIMGQDVYVTQERVKGFRTACPSARRCCCAGSTTISILHTVSSKRCSPEKIARALSSCPTTTVRSRHTTHLRSSGSGSPRTCL